MKSFDALLFTIKAALVVNGGAAIALIALLNTVPKDQPLLSLEFNLDLIRALLYFWLGVCSALIAGLCNYWYLRDYKASYGKIIGVLCTVFQTGSVLAFMVGTARAVNAFMNLNSSYLDILRKSLSTE
ncbi:MAG: hypothetical protein WD118_09920 [Phycisphaeraceae bacterium]